MAWIKTLNPEEGGDPLLRALADQRALYPKEYAEPIAALEEGRPGIVAVHSLIPQALYHSFAAFGSLMAPELPLTRRRHEMIAVMVSLTNECRY
ncbi:MAG: hypothetical protein NVSMB14_01550 [Isosphaeraceae bacterium]